MFDSTVLTIEMIVSSPQVRGGKPIIAGTSLRVQDVAEAQRFRAYTPDQIADQYQISLAQVFAALSYYYAHQAEINHDIQNDLVFAREAKANRLG